MTSTSDAAIESKQTPQFISVRHAAPVAPLRNRSYAKSDAPDSKIWSLKDLLKEADRAAGNSVHVETPKPPLWLEGSSSVVAARAMAWHAHAKTADGRRLYRTAPALAGVVVSYPRDLAQESWRRYRDDIIDYYKTTHGERVVGVVEHDDEAQHHIHLYLVPLHGEEFGAVHPGIAARQAERRLAARDVRVARDSAREAKRRGVPVQVEFEVDQDGNGKRKRIHRPMTAFKLAMSRMQDTVFEAVSKKHGLVRHGEKRRRLERSLHLRHKRADQEAAEVVGRARKAADELVSRARIKAEEASERAAAAEARWIATQALWGRMQELMAQLAAAVAELGRLDKILYSKGAPGRQLQEAEERVAIYRTAYVDLASRLHPTVAQDFKFVPGFAEGNHALVQRLTSEYEAIARDWTATLHSLSKVSAGASMRPIGPSAHSATVRSPLVNDAQRASNPNFIDVNAPVRPQVPAPGQSNKKLRR